MTKRRVQLFGQSRGIEIDTAATDGAVVGVNLRWPNGQLVTEDDFGGTQGEDPGVTYWRTIEEIPPNVTALEGAVGAGLYAITGNGTSATRAIEAVAGELTVENGDGVGGNPRLGLAEITHEDGGLLQKTAFDEHGRRTHEGSANTDDLPEGASALYFTDDRALIASQKPVDVRPLLAVPIRSSDRARWIRVENPRGNIAIMPGGWAPGDELSIHAAAGTPGIIAPGIVMTAMAGRFLAASAIGAVIHLKFHSETEAHVYGDLSGSPPSLRLLAESGDFLVTESGDHLRV